MNYETATDSELEVELYTKANKLKLINIEDVPFYCTDWNATMTLAVEHGLSMIKMDSGYQVVHDYDYIDVGFHDDINNCWIEANAQYGHCNPLRAIMICLIKVLEKQND